MVAMKSATYHRFTYKQALKMVRAGILNDQDPIELIDGLLADMKPFGTAHGMAVFRLNAQFSSAVGDGAFVSVQNPLHLSKNTVPQPDIIVFRGSPHDYINKPPSPAKALLVIEVADSSYRYDRRVKIPLFERAGIPEAWIVNVTSGYIEVFRDVSPSGYASVTRHGRGATISSLLLPNITVTVSDVLSRRTHRGSRDLHDSLEHR